MAHAAESSGGASRERVPRLAWGDAPLAPCVGRSSDHVGLDAENLVEWLSSRQLLGQRRVEVLDLLSGRAFAALVRFDDGSALFLKQPLEAIPPLGALREGLLLRLIADDDDLQGVRPLLPRTILYDEHDNVVVSAGLSEHRTMHEVGVPPGDDVLRATARCLATLHAESSGVRMDTRHYYAINPVFDFSRVTPRSFAQAPGTGFGTYLAAMQALDGPLGAIADQWRPTCLIHGDFRDDNILVADRPGAEMPIAFVDWELGGWGDPLWDLGAWIGQFLYYWVESIKASTGGDFSSWVRDATIPFASIQRASRTILTSYAEASGRPMAGAEGFAARALQLAGVFLLHRVLGALESVGAIHAAAFCSLQVGRTLVTQPDRAKAILA
jgi:Phosphotransferase enzyme family